MPLSFPYFADPVLQWLVLPLVFVSGQFYFFVVYYFSFYHYIQTVVVLLAHSADSFSFPCSLWFLKFRCLGWLPAATVFLLLPKFICERSTEIRGRRLQFSLCLYCEHEILGKAVSFWSFHLWMEVVDYTTPGISFSTRRSSLPREIFLWGRRSRLGEERRIMWCWWCWCGPSSNVSVLDKQFELLFLHHSGTYVS